MRTREFVERQAGIIVLIPPPLLFTAAAKDKMKSKITTFLVFDYMEHDFQGLLRRRQNFSRVQVKCVMQQLFRGLQYLHKSNIIHRDLKSQYSPLGGGNERT